MRTPNKEPKQEALRTLLSAGKKIEKSAEQKKWPQTQELEKTACSLKMSRNDPISISD